jgi:hypothetical protein
MGLVGLMGLLSNDGAYRELGNGFTMGLLWVYDTKNHHQDTRYIQILICHYKYF